MRLSTRAFIVSAAIVVLLAGLTPFSHAAKQEDDPGRGNVGSPPSKQKYVPDRIIVKPKPGVSDSEMKKLHIKHGVKQGKVFKRFGNIQVVHLPKGSKIEKFIEKYEKSGLVLYAEPDHQGEVCWSPGDPSFMDGTLWGLDNHGDQTHDIDAPEGWDVIHDASNVIVAVIDTGVRCTHEDLVDNLWTNSADPAGDANADGYPGVQGVDDDGDGLTDEDSMKRQPGEPGYNNDLADDDDENGFIDTRGINARFREDQEWDSDYMDQYSDPTPRDFAYHGTHVAGTVGARGENGKGVVGVAPYVKMMALRWIPVQDDFYGWYPAAISDAIQCIEYAIDKGAHIMNNSWRDVDGYSQALYDAVAAARDPNEDGNTDDGIIFVAAAGNNGANADYAPTYPAAFDLDNIVSVAALDSGDQLAGFSNTGAESVDLAAPGVNIYSSIFWPIASYDDKYEYEQGTSMAAPHVAGALALLKAKYPTENYRQLITRLYHSTVRIDSLIGKCRTEGRLNLKNLLTETPPDLCVLSKLGFTGSGGPGGPFAPTKRTYTLTNFSGAPLAWSVSCDQNWLSFSSTGGTLAVGQTLDVDVYFNTNAETLGKGTYSGVVTFTNSTAGVSTTRNVTLTVNVIHVKEGGEGDGSSWASPLGSVQSGLDAAYSRNIKQVWVAAGTYNEAPRMNSTQNGVALYGGFAGNEARLEQRPAFPRPISDPYRSTLCGSGEEVVKIYNCPDPNTRLDGFTIDNSGNGSGVYVRGSYYPVSATVVNNTVTGNSGWAGAGVCIASWDGGTTIVKDNIITGNLSNYYDDSDGGGIACYGSRCIITGNTVSGNVAPQQGGGIYLKCSPDAVVANNIIANNGVTGYVSGYGKQHMGGGICLNGGHVLVANNTIVGNWTQSGNGGAVYCTEEAYACDENLTTDIRLVNNIIAHNTSGIIKDAVVTPTITSDCVWDNGPYDFKDRSGVPWEPAGNLASDPELAAVEYGRWHIQPSSPCRDAGDDSVVQAGWLDVDRQARVQGTQVDIGVDESDGAVWTESPVVIRVSPGGTGDGSSWATAKGSIQAAMDQVSQQGGGEVWVRAGAYAERLNLRPYVNLYGGFDGLESSKAERDWKTNITTIDASGATAGRAITAVGGKNTVDGFAIRNGTGGPNYSGYYSSGGGVYACASWLDLTNDEIADNSAEYYGGGVCYTYAGGVVSGNSVRDNAAGTSSGYGGGIYCDRSMLSVLGNTIDGNEANIGGGIYGCGGLNIACNLVRGNQASQYARGGGICLENGQFCNLINNTIVENTCAYDGAGVYLSANDTVFANNIVAHNIGQGLYGYANIRHNDFWQNTPNYPEGMTLGPNNLTVDPQFANRAAGDFHLLPGSECGDNGDNTALQSTWLDIDGEARVQPTGGTVDIGADELVQTGAVATPTFSPDGGTFADYQTVTISCSTSGAEIHYTSDGSRPLLSSPLYTSPVLLQKSMTLQARAFKAGYAPSDIKSAVYTINKCAPPFFVPPGGAYEEPIDVYIDWEDEYANVVYTTDGTEPVEGVNGEWYWWGDPIPISTNTTLKAVACRWDMSPSDVVTAVYVFGQVATPVISPPGGNYNDTQTVTITCTSVNAEIRYTLDGSEPTQSSTLYNVPFTVSADATIKARAWKGTLTPSDIATAQYTLKVSTPAIEPISGQYDLPQTVTVTCATSGAQVHYTIDGTDPTEGSPLYSGPFTVSENTTVKAKAWKGTIAPSDMLTAQYTIKVAAPVIEPPAGEYDTPQTINMTCATPSAQIYYTLDGTEPTQSSTLYTGSFTVSGDVTIKAGAFKANMLPSDIVSATYLIPDIRFVKAGTAAGNDGLTWETAYDTIQSAIDNAVPERQIRVAAGTYNENIVVGQDIELLGGYQGSGSTRDPAVYVTTIDGQDLSSVVRVLAGTTSALRIDGFTLQNGVGTGMGTPFGGGVYCQGEATVSNNTITGCSASFGAGISCVTGSGSSVIEGNRIVGNSGVGVDIQGNCAPKVIGNYIGQQTYTGILVWSNQSGIEIVNNVIHGNGANNDLEAGGIRCMTDSRPTITNNTITENHAGDYGGGGIRVDQNAAPKIYNNIVVYNDAHYGGGGIHAYNAAAVVHNNDVFGSSSGSVGAGNYFGIDPDSSNISTDPGLLSMGGGDFHLANTSPCANAGLNTAPGIAASDLDGQDRIYNGTVDIGADEYFGEVRSTVATPTFSPDGGLYNDMMTVTIGCATPGAVIHFTNNGTEATEHSPIYSGPITIPGSMVIEAKAWKSGMNPSDTQFAPYTLQVATPVLSPAGGTFGGPMQATITCSTLGAWITYTLDGTEPTESSTPYAGPIPIDETTTVKAKAWCDGMEGSNTASATYTIVISSIRYVKAATPAGNDGLSWETAYDTVQGAVDNAQPGHEIRVAQGVYQESISIYSNVALLGGYLGTGDTRDPKTYFTCLDAGGVNTVIDIGPGLSRATIIDGFTIRNGMSLEAAGIRCSGSATITNNVITDNDSAVTACLNGRGGGIRCSAGDPLISHNLIKNNSAFHGGGIYIDATANPEIVNNVIADNHAIYDSFEVGTGGFGAGIYCGGGSPSITNNTIVGNIGNDAGGGKGGGIYVSNGGAWLANNIIAFNSDGVSDDGTVEWYIFNNDVFGNLDFNYETGIPAGTGDISQDPKFMCRASGDYRLIPGSPCINAGLDSSATWATDFGGQGRIYGTHVDIGADEYHGESWTQVATPTISPSGGTYGGPQTVTIACSTPGAVIHYTTDGVDPTEDGPVYTAPFIVSENATVKAKAWKSGQIPSNTQSAAYTLKVATPVISPNGGTFVTSTTVTITCPTPDAIILYTLDGTEPTHVYTEPITIRQNTPLKARACKTGYTDSDDAFAIFVIKMPSPTMTPPGGTYSGAQSVTLQCSVSDASIYYTTNGTEPDFNSTRYVNPIPISSTTTLKAKAFKGGCAWSDTTTAVYTIMPKVATPVLSPVGGTYITSVQVSITCATTGATIRYTLDGSTPTTSSPIYTSPITVDSTTGYLDVPTTPVKAKAFKTGMAESDVALQSYTIKSATPTFSPDGGTYGSTQNVTMNCATPGATIYYTIDGTTPSITNGTVYTGAVAVSQTLTLKAVAIQHGCQGSDVKSATYTIQPVSGVKFVDHDAPGPAHDGLSWTTAFQTVQAGLNAAAAGEAVWVAAGTYTENITLRNGVALYGGFAGVEYLESQRDWRSNVTILSGGDVGTVVQVANAMDCRTRVDGFTIRDGRGSDAFGAGIDCRSSQPTIANNIITDNYAEDPYNNARAGGVFCDSSTPIILNNSLVENTSEGNGGGLELVNCSGVIANSVIRGNGAYFGGGISCSMCTGPLKIVNNTIVSNIAMNYSNGSGGIGGGVVCGGAVMITNNIVAWNTGMSGCGGIVGDAQTVLRNNDVYGNLEGSFPGDYLGCTPDTASISLDPLFVDLAGGNLRLKSSSPCIDAGQIEIVWVDMDGHERILPQGGKVDIGAYEHVPGIAVIRKGTPDNMGATINGVSVTACFLSADPSGENWVYVENADRTAGIRLKTPAGYSIGTILNVSGTMQADSVNGERYVDVYPEQTGPAGGSLLIGALGMRNEWIGGAAPSPALVLKDGFGFYNTGMLVHTWGRVTYSSAAARCFYIDDGSNLWDGSGRYGVRVIVPSGLTPPYEGQYVKVTGISSAIKIGANYVRVVRARDASDILTVTDWFTDPIGVFASQWNMLTLPGIPRYPAAESIFKASTGQPSILLDGNLKRYDAQSQAWVYFQSCNGSMNSLVADGYGLYILPDGAAGYDYQRTLATGDQFISLPRGSSPAQYFSLVGQPLDYDRTWSSVKVTDGNWIMALPEAISLGWIHRVDCWTGSSWTPVTNLSTGSMARRTGYCIYPKVNGLALVVPAQ